MNRLKGLASFAVLDALQTNNPSTSALSFLLIQHHSYLVQNASKDT